MSARTQAQAPVVSVDEAIVEAYRAADKSAKAKIRKSLEEARDAGIEALDMAAVASAKATLEACLVKPAAARETVAPEVALANRIATLRLAITMLEEGTAVPDGIAEGTTVADGGEADVQAAIKIASTKITRSGERHSIGAAIERAFADAGSATLTVREIAKRGALDGYEPSDGAIANALKSGVEGLVVIERDAAGPLRARVA